MLTLINLPDPSGDLYKIVGKEMDKFDLNKAINELWRLNLRPWTKLFRKMNHLRLLKQIRESTL